MNDPVVDAIKQSIAETLRDVVNKETRFRVHSELMSYHGAIAFDLLKQIEYDHHRVIDARQAVADKRREDTERGK